MTIPDPNSDPYHFEVEHLTARFVYLITGQAPEAIGGYKRDADHGCGLWVKYTKPGGAQSFTVERVPSKGGHIQVAVVVNGSDPLFEILPRGSTTTVQDIVTTHLGYGDVSAVRVSLLRVFWDESSKQQVDRTCTLASVAVDGRVSLYIEQ